jgi:hypothetical protein
MSSYLLWISRNWCVYSSILIFIIAAYFWAADPILAISWFIAFMLVTISLRQWLNGLDRRRMRDFTD